MKTKLQLLAQQALNAAEHPWIWTDLVQLSHEFASVVRELFQHYKDHPEEFTTFPSRHAVIRLWTSVLSQLTVGGTERDVLRILTGPTIDEAYEQCKKILIHGK